jgi:hypothetical protein
MEKKLARQASLSIDLKGKEKNVQWITGVKARF